MKQSEQIAKKMIEYLSHIIDEDFQETDPFDISIGFWSNDKELAYKYESLIIIDSCVETILDFNYRQYGKLFNFLDDSYVREKLINIAADAKKNPDPNKYNLLETSIEKFFKNLKIVEFFSYLKIANFKVSKIYDFDSFKLYPNHEEYTSKIFQNTNEAQKRELESAFKKKSDRYQTIMELHFFSMDAGQTKKNTLHKVNDYLNVFKVLGALDIFVEGDFERKFTDVFVLNSETLDLGRFGHYERPEDCGRVFNLSDFEQKYPQMIQKIRKLFSINGNDLDKKMLNFLLWWGDSIDEPNLSRRLLKMIISIESLLLNSDDRGTKSYLLEDRAVFLLANDYKKRCWISDTIKEAYSVRNKIVHSGEKQIIPNRLIRDLGSIAYELNNLFLTSDKFQTFEDVKREVINKKFQKN